MPSPETFDCNAFPGWEAVCMVRDYAGLRHSFHVGLSPLTLPNENYNKTLLVMIHP